MRAIEKVAPISAAALALTIALGASGVAAALLVRSARAAASAQIAATAGVLTPAVQASRDPKPLLEGLAAVPAVDSAKLYRANGELIADYQRLPLRPRFYALAARLAPPEVSCGGTTFAGAPATLCFESSPAAVAPAVRRAVLLVAFAPLLALLLGGAIGMLLGRAAASRMAGVTGVIDRVVREHAYSARVDPAAGAFGKMSAAINELLSQVQERDVIVRRRTLELEAVNKDLESFAYSVSHDLRAPLGSIDGFTQALEMDYGHLFDENAKEYMQWVREGCAQMRDLIDGLLQMTRLTRQELQRVPVDLSSIARSVADMLQQSNPQRAVKFEIRDGVRTVGDERLLRAVLENLMANAWKFTRNRNEARIEFGERAGAYFVRDNGAGFDPAHAAKMFRPFQRLHSSREFEGTGIGLATVQKIVERHGGRAWAEGEVEKGATIFFTTGSEHAA
ncbi:MAG TPA: ATP-binding protein [Thermoanaerobaculia bacterium]|jgi:signal transduction histidine kinase